MGGRKRILAFHRDYPDAIAIMQPPVAQLSESAKVPQSVAQLIRSQEVSQPVAQLREPLLWSVPWGYHIILMDKVPDLSVRRWFVGLKSQFVISSWRGSRHTHVFAPDSSARTIVQGTLAQLSWDHDVTLAKEFRATVATDGTAQQAAAQLPCVHLVSFLRCCGTVQEVGYGG